LLVKVGVDPGVELFVGSHQMGSVGTVALWASTL